VENVLKFLVHILVVLVTPAACVRLARQAIPEDHFTRGHRLVWILVNFSLITPRVDVSGSHENSPERALRFEFKF
jgi:hypothetical protein